VNLSLGFALVVILFLLPGLIFRRLYFFGEFSKQFDAGLSLPYLLGKALIPGLFIALICFVLFHKLYSEIDLDSLAAQFKLLSAEPTNGIGNEAQSVSIQSVVDASWRFVIFLYASSITMGLVAGRFVRTTNLDTRFKLLRFSNAWYYLLTNKHTLFKRLKAHRVVDKEFLFTTVDVLVNLNDKPRLYSGVVVDYEIDPQDCSKLTKLILREAERYHEKEGIVSRKQIPGDFFVLNCTDLMNLNLTHVYENQIKIDWLAKLPRVYSVGLFLFLLLVSPFFIFKSDSITNLWYESYFKQHFFLQLLIYLIAAVNIGNVSPFVKNNGKFQWVTALNLLGRFVVLVISLVIAWLILR